MIHTIVQVWLQTGKISLECRQCQHTLLIESVFFFKPVLFKFVLSLTRFKHLFNFHYRICYKCVLEECNKLKNIVNRQTDIVTVIIKAQLSLGSGELKSIY